ncbi:hypothetical protein CCR94_20125 [Rhodoblastus sphagnicola]|uniref:Uncharacterized protein n=1 Tax=Rhodoblastus sphagnicola TaxID=333368 RepID=A0A2S6MYJ0_9HYPH|nr:hypothetical protein [Rhodoblastus sphagnicola]MBB4200802.1 hypothetical protein [Rhodoblastus sphagnicola]PPQ27420.1 hypothetical protein CCR94_20125 [Rhodoblastus sphagnicola]
MNPHRFRGIVAIRRRGRQRDPQRKFSLNAAIFTLSLFAGIGFRIEPLRLLAPSLAPVIPKRSETMSDALFLVFGLALIGVMAAYIHALTRA